MEFKDFDDFVKQHMTDFEAVPSEELGKALAGKMFFQNLMVFHKVKLIAALVAIAAGTTFYFNYETNTSGQGSGLADQSEIYNESEDTQNSKIDIVVNAKETANDSEMKNSGSSDVPMSNEKSKIEISNRESVDLKSETSVDAKVVPNSVYFEKTDQVNNTVVASDSKKTSVKQDVQNNRAKSELKPIQEDIRPQEAMNEGQHPEQSGVEVAQVGVSIKKLQLDRYANKNAQPIDSAVEAGLNLAVVDWVDPYVATHKLRGFTLEAYMGAFNKTDINNYLNEEYQKYWWDFYKENGKMQSSNNLGLSLNYNWNGIKIGTGLGYMQMRDYRPRYEYWYDEDYLQNLGGGVVSGAYVYGEAQGTDTMLVYYVDRTNPDIVKEFERNYDTYTYLKVPLTIGYELSLKKFSIELNAGLEYNRLVGATGFRITEGDSEHQTAPIYFYNHLYLTQYAARNEEFNRNIFGFNANAVFRAKVSSHFDLFASYNKNAGYTGIFKESHFLRKDYRNTGFRFGLTYHFEGRDDHKKM